MKRKLPKQLLHTVAVAALYILPVIFFISVYFLQTVSSEDIYQGAGKPVAITQDIAAAFNWNARLGDMYAWPVINFFDYTYQFGIDTIFRLLDVVLAVGIFYLMTFFILGRRPRWQIKDALVFNVSFLAVFLSDFSRSLVSSFSHIHNYLPTTLLPLLFALPFVLALHGKKVLQNRWGKAAAFVLGVFFALSSNVTPIALIATLAIITGFQYIKAKKKPQFKQFLWSWQLFALVGAVFSFAIMYLVGPGVSSYTQGYNGSYVALGDVLRLPGEAGIALIGNMVSNIRLVMPIFLMLGFAVLVEFALYKKRLIRTTTGLKFTGAIALFFLLHTLAVSQVDVSTTMRILLPAYVFAVIGVLFTANRLVQLADVKRKALLVISLPVILVTSIITLDITALMVKHQKQATTVLERIEFSDEGSVCVTPKDNPTAKSPLMKYYQRELFIDWTMPETIYGKQVDWCK